MSTGNELNSAKVANIRATLAAGPVAKPKGPGFKGIIEKLTPKFMRKQKAFVRRHERYECCIVGELELSQRFLSLEGVILEVSQGGVLFRQASTYMLERHGELVKVKLEGQLYSGMIMASRPIGYGIKLNENIPSEVIEEIVMRYGLKSVAIAA